MSATDKPAYEVEMTVTLTVVVDANDEEAAVEAAYDVVEKLDRVDAIVSVGTIRDGSVLRADDPTVAF